MPFSMFTKAWCRHLFGYNIPPFYLALLLLEVQVWNLAQLFDEFSYIRIFDWLWRYDNLHREVFGTLP